MFIPTERIVIFVKKIYLIEMENMLHPNCLALNLGLSQTYNRTENSLNLFGHAQTKTTPQILSFDKYLVNVTTRCTSVLFC